MVLGGVLGGVVVRGIVELMVMVPSHSFSQSTVLYSPASNMYRPGVVIR